MAQHLFYVSDDKLAEYKQLTSEQRRRVNDRLRKVFDSAIKNEKKNG